MQVIFDDEIHVHYSNMYIDSDVNGTHDLTMVFAGQTNGLCGAAEAGLLFLTTGLHTGNVGLTIEVHDTPPAIADTWEDVVEVSFTPSSSRVLLLQWAGEKWWELPLATQSYRVRYCAAGMDQAREADTTMPGQPPLDRYLLQLWPAPPEPDQVIRHTSVIAGHWHSHAQSLPAPPGHANRSESQTGPPTS